MKSSLLFTQKLTCFFMFKITSIITCKTKKLVCFLPQKWLAFSCSEFTSIIPCKIKKLVCFLHKKWLAFHFYDLWPLTIEIGKLFAFNPESDLFFIYTNLHDLLLTQKLACLSFLGNIFEQVYFYWYAFYFWTISNMEN